jgi:hypothetical protein
MQLCISLADTQTQYDLANGVLRHKIITPRQIHKITFFFCAHDEFGYASAGSMIGERPPISTDAPDNASKGQSLDSRLTGVM